jgi:hypothetical protein
MKFLKSLNNEIVLIAILVSGMAISTILCIIVSIIRLDK